MSFVVKAFARYRLSDKSGVTASEDRKSSCHGSCRRNIKIFNKRLWLFLQVLMGVFQTQMCLLHNSIFFQTKWEIGHFSRQAVKYCCQDGLQMAFSLEYNGDQHSSRGIRSQTLKWFACNDGPSVCSSTFWTGVVFWWYCMVLVAGVWRLFQRKQWGRTYWWNIRPMTSNRFLRC